MIYPHTVYGACADGMSIGAVLTNFVDEHVGMLIAFSSILVGAISWAFMGG